MSRLRHPAAAALLAGLALGAPTGAAAEERESGDRLRLLDFEIADPAAGRVLERTTIARATEPTRFPGRVAHEEFLLDRLPLSAAVGRRLSPALEQYRIVEKGPGVWAMEEGESIKGQTRLIASATGRRVYIVQGEFRSLAQLVRFDGAMVITLRYWEEEQGGHVFLGNEPHVYVRIENVLLHGLAKLLSPILHGIVERRVARLAAAAKAVSERITRDPAGLYREMLGWPEVSEKDRADFRRYFGIEEQE